MAYSYTIYYKRGSLFIFHHVQHVRMYVSGNFFFFAFFILDLLAGMLASQNLRHLSKGLIEFVGVLAAAACLCGFAATFAADDRCNGLDDTTGLHLIG